MDRRGKTPEYNITDDILSKAACIVEKIQGLSVLNGGSVGGVENRERLLGEQNEVSGTETDFLIYRQKGTGVFAGEHLLCRAPMPQYVEELMGELNDWLEQSMAHPLIKAGIVLYQYVMVQFYEDNNTCYGIKRAEKLLEQWKLGLRGLELKHRPTFRDNYLLPAMRMGVVEMTIPDKPNSSNQRYRKCIG